MDCLPLGMHAFLVPLIFCVLHSVTCQPFMQGQMGFGQPFGQMQQMFPVPRIYQPYNQFQRMNYMEDYYPRRKQPLPVQNVRTRQQYNVVQPRDNVRPIARYQQAPLRSQPVYNVAGPQTYRTYQPLVKSIQTQPPKVVTRPPTMLPRRTIKKATPQLTGILSNVMPHPKQRFYDRMSAKKRARFRAVARAKSFPGIIKNTALENKTRR